MAGELHRYFLNNSHKLLHKWLHYFDIYERHLERFRNKESVMLEIGVFGGGSLAMWKDYLGPQSKIIGVDINPACKAHEGTGIDVFIGSQDDPSLMTAILAKYPHIDVVLDDGSHQMHHMIQTFELLYERIANDAVYIVEDTHTCYWPDFGGCLGGPDTFIEFAKKKIDALNAFHTQGALSVTEFTRTTDSISFYDSVVVFEKRRQGSRQAIITKPA